MAMAEVLEVRIVSQYGVNAPERVELEVHDFRDCLEHQASVSEGPEVRTKADPGKHPGLQAGVVGGT
ncbi:hypothetical protein ABIB14_000975 [Arthrobacter sp. UYEF3]